MSSRILPRKPAFVTLQPNLPEFIPVGSGELSALLAVIGPGQLFRRKGANGSPAGYYLHRSEKGGTLFVKVVPASHADRQRTADAIASWAAQFGVRTAALLPQYPRTLDNGHVVFAYHYIAGRFANTTISDLGQIGSGLATLHVALSKFPDGTTIRRESAIRTEMLIGRCDLICKGMHAPGPWPKKLREIFERESSLFSMLDDTSANQPLHGDLVYGNILFPLEGGAPILLDFEDTLISWLPVDLDIALALERFVLVPEQNDPIALALGREMLRAYGQHSGGSTRFMTYPLSDCLRLLSVRALATLAELEAKGEAVDVTEWDKFFDLYGHAKAREPLLTELQDGFVA